ncbi:MAG: hypothetical protein AAB116_14685 [Candidatus Poribacteria bacterium]|mgnify:CR=1 FL=1
MNTNSKISPAFEPFLAESGPNDKREAIVIYRSQTNESTHVRGRLRELQMRLNYVKERASLQKPVQDTLFDDYKKASLQSGKQGKASGANWYRCRRTDCGQQ